MGFNICFALGYKAEDKTVIYRKLVDIFGVGGMVSRDQEGRVLDFNIETDYGILYLSRDSGVLLLDMAGTTEADGVISSVVKPDAIITSVFSSACNDCRSCTKIDIIFVCQGIISAFF